jgi:transcriptional regulator with XRE-family HTH domain
MIKNKKTLVPEEIPEFFTAIDEMPLENKIFVDKSLEITQFIFQVLENKGLKQKDLAEKMGKTEAEISKWLGGMHNYTLRSLAKIEAALGTHVVCTPAYQVYYVPTTLTPNKRVEIKERLRTAKKIAPIVYGKLISIKDSQQELSLPTAI